MNQCPKCKKSFKRISENCRVYPELPFEHKLVFLVCTGCGVKQILPEIQKIITKARRGMFFEHYGNQKFIKSLNSKDHFQTVDESSSMLGEAPKRIYINPSDKQRYLFKWPKKKENGFNHGFRETVTELIMNTLSAKLAKTSMSSMGRIYGRPVFIGKIFLDKNHQRLVHGVEIFEKIYGEGSMEEIQKNRKDQKEFYTLEHIVEALESYCDPNSSLQVRNDFYTMVLVDAWLGNQDRHAENWGVVVPKKTNGNTDNTFFAPLFDTARGLLWNETLFGLYSKFCGTQKNKKIDQYVEDSTPLMSLNGNSDVNHFDLAKFVCKDAPEVFFLFKQKLSKIDISREIRRFDSALHRVRIQLIMEILEKRRAKLIAL